MNYDFGKFPKVEVQKSWCVKLLKGEYELNDWEMKFVRDLSCKLIVGTKLKDTQVFKLETIYAKYTN